MELSALSKEELVYVIERRTVEEDTKAELLSRLAAGEQAIKRKQADMITG